MTLLTKHIPVKARTIEKLTQKLDKLALTNWEVATQVWPPRTQYGLWTAIMYVKVKQ